MMGEYSSKDLLIKAYARYARKIYHDRTGGDYTWEGLFFEFARRLEEESK